MWSLGGILYTLLSGESLFEGDTIEEVMSATLSGDWKFRNKAIWDKISDLGKDFISKLLVIDYTKRMSAKEALKHEWLSKAPENKLDENIVKDYI